MRPRSLSLASLIALLLLLASLGQAVPGMRADDGDTIRDFVGAINSGDTAAAMQKASPSLTWAMANGEAITLGQAQPLPARMLPITIVSLSPEGQGTKTVDAVLTFGADPTQQQAQFKGDNGSIVSIVVLGPAS